LLIFRGGFRGSLGIDTKRCAALAPLALTAAAVVAGLGPGSATAAARGVVITPKPAERIGKHPVRIVVRAGPEHGDLRARLNGVQVGEEFVRASRGRRVLKASNSHGLKHGHNKLRVVAERNGAVRRRTVRFRVGHRRPMAGAGLDLRAQVAGRARLEGEVARRKGGHRPRPVRWRVVKAPKQAQISTGTRARRAAALQRALRSPRTATPIFRPEVLGRYVLEFKAGSGTKATTDELEVLAVPPVGQLEVDTGVDHGGGVFGIKVGDRDFQAPPMHQDGTSVSWVGSSDTWSHYAALWQVLVLERKTLQVDSNTTYGYCQGPQGQGICQKGDNGEPFLVLDPAAKATAGSAAALRQQLLNLGPKRVVVAASHYDDDLAWGNFDTGSIATGALSAIGFPSKPSQGLTKGGSAAAIGVPGVQPGEGDFQIPGTAQRMRGYLTPDTLDHFDFIPLARQPFDTRASGSCTASECTWAMSVGGQEQLWPGSPGPAPRTITGKVANGEAGYLVAALDGHDLSLIGSEVFVTEGDLGDFNGATQRMTAFLQKANAAGNVVMISSLHTPKQSRATLANSSINDDAWVELARAVAQTGGSRHEFNVAAHDDSRDYSLVGRGGIGEGEGVETASGGGARVRGSLAPDNASLFGPVNTSTDPGAAGAPADRLNQLLLMPPTAWTPMSSPGARDALRALGCNVGLTEDPRAKYADLDAELADQKHSAVNDANFDGVKGDGPCNTGLTYTSEEFTEAQGQLKQELLWVGNVRIYFDYLAYPYGNVSSNAAVETQHLADYLEAELNAYDKEAELGFDPLGFLVALLNIAGAAIGDPDLGQQVKVMSGVVQMAKQFASTDYSGRAPDIDNQPRIQADELADRLKEDADGTIHSYERMGDMIVSDPAKLKEVGLRANCFKPCVPNQPVLDEYATPKIEEAKRVANLGLERTIYEHLVPVSFPVYDLGLTTNPTPQNLSCDETGATPFEDLEGAVAPRRSWEPSLDEFHPSGSPSRWRVQIMVHRQNATYSWPDQTLLDRMFNAVDVDADFPSTPPPGEDEGDPLPGLAIDRVDLLREATSRFVPSSTDPCGWED
jgi:hypothetical protein